MTPPLDHRVRVKGKKSETSQFQILTLMQTLPFMQYCCRLGRVMCLSFLLKFTLLSEIDNFGVFSKMAQFQSFATCILDHSGSQTFS